MPAIGTPILNVIPPVQNVTWTRNTPFPTLVDIGLSTNDNTFYTEFTIVNENTNTPWITLYGFVDNSSGIVYFDPGSNSAMITPILQNIDALSGNYYTTKIRFRQGNAEKVHTINLTITGEYSTVKTDKTNYSLVYNRITNTLSGDTLVNILNNTENDPLSMVTFGDLLLEKSFTNSFTLEEDPLFPFATSSELPTTGSKIVSCQLKNDAGVSIQTFTVTIQVVNTNDISTDVDVLNFSLYKHLSESKSQVLKIINPANLDFTITSPDFINLTSNSGNSTIDVTIETENSATLLAQEYTGDIVISYGAKSLVIPVLVKNIDFVDLKIGDYNFCLDDFILTVQKINDAAKFVKISLVIEISTPNNNFTVSPNYQIAYFNNEASTDVGKKIHNHFPIFEGHLFSKNDQVDFNNQRIYNAAKVKITIEELNADYEVVFSRIIDNLKMFPGKKPIMFPLFTNSQIKSRYAGSGYIFSYLSSLVAPSDVVSKPISSNSFSPDQVQSVFFDDSDELLDFGDYKNVLGIDFIKKNKGDNQIFVQFINQNLVPELAVFNGFYKIEEDSSHTYDDYEYNAKKYDTKIVGKAILSTGFIFKEEVDMVSEISKSVIAYIKVADEIYKCLPIPGKIDKVNTESNLVIFELEFLIVK